MSAETLKALIELSEASSEEVREAKEKLEKNPAYELAGIRSEAHKVNEKSRPRAVLQMWGKQKEILRLLASGLYTAPEIGKILNVHPVTVNAIANSALGRQMLEIYQGAADYDTVELYQRIKALAPIALSVQEELLLSEETTPGLKNKIADKIIDRAGYTPISKNLNVNVKEGVSKEQLEEIKKRAEELRTEMAIKTEYQEVPTSQGEGADKEKEV